MPDSITAKTGQAKVVRLGHTKGTTYGTDNAAQKVGRTEPVVLRAK